MLVDSMKRAQKLKSADLGTAVDRHPYPPLSVSFESRSAANMSTVRSIMVLVRGIDHVNQSARTALNTAWIFISYALEGDICVRGAGTGSRLVRGWRSGRASAKLNSTLVAQQQNPCLNIVFIRLINQIKAFTEDVRPYPSIVSYVIC
jgi:hypothetical protein